MRRGSVRRLIGPILAAALALALGAPTSAGPDGPIAGGPGHEPSPAGARGAVPPVDPDQLNLAGLWDFGDGLVVQIEQSGPSVTSRVVTQACTGADHTEFMTATVAGESLAGTMHRCTPEDDIVVTDFGCDQLWSTPFSAEASRHEITGTYRGEWITDVGCALDYYYDASFSGTRIDCRPLTFEELAKEHPDGATDIELAKEFEAGKTLHWTPEQIANGFRERAQTFAATLGRMLGGIYGPGTINSAFRPLLYQAHFANLRECGLTLIGALQTWGHEPDIVQALGRSVAALKAEVTKHGIKSEVTTIAGQSVPVPFVCWRDPLSGCPHVDGKAIDVSFRQADGLDWEGAIHGWCRRYLPVDPPHWEEISEGRCGADYLPGRADIDLYVESPVAVVVTDGSGRRVGQDPVTGAAVNDHGPGAFYTGPDTEPQRLFIPAGVGAGDEVEITLTPIGEGPYTVRLNFRADDGIDEAGFVFEGIAQVGRAIASVRQAFIPASSIAPYPEAEPIGAQPGWDISYLASSPPAGQPRVVSLRPAIADAVLVNEQLPAVGIRLASQGGGPVAVGLPSGFLPAVRVMVDGSEVSAAVEQGGDGVIVRFTVPPGATTVEIRGDASPGAVGGMSPILVVGGLVLLIVSAAGAFLLWRRSSRARANPSESGS